MKQEVAVTNDIGLSCVIMQEVYDEPAEFRSDPVARRGFGGRLNGIGVRTSGYATVLCRSYHRHFFQLELCRIVTAFIIFLQRPFSLTFMNGPYRCFSRITHASDISFPGNSK